MHSSEQAAGLIKFFHSFDLPGETITGARAIAEPRTYADVIFSEPVAGKTVLDVGAWDGFFSFEAEKRGAARVHATDHFCWSGLGWGTKDGFDYVQAKIGSKVESTDVDVFGLDPATHGTYDFVMMLGVLYHLKNPFGGLEKVAAMTTDCLVVETQTDAEDVSEPVMRYYLGDEFNGDGSNFWGPNTLCVKNMLKELGFVRFREWHMIPGAKANRLIMHAWRS